jgi:hypothetical protein
MAYLLPGRLVRYNALGEFCHGRARETHEQRASQRADGREGFA